MPPRRALLTPCLAFAALLGAVSPAIAGFTVTARTPSAPVGAAVVLEARITLAEGEYLYDPKSDGGLPTAMTIEADGLRVDGELEGPKPKRKFDENLGADVLVHEGTVVFTRRVILTGEPGLRLISGEMSYQICDAGTCRPVNEEFEVEVEAQPAGLLASKDFDVAFVELKLGASAAEAGGPLELKVDIALGDKSYIYTATTPAGFKSRIELDEGSAFTLAGSLTGGESKSKQDPYLGRVEIQKGALTWIQTLTAPDTVGTASLAGRFVAQVCDDKGCYPIELPFTATVEVKPASRKAAPATGAGGFDAGPRLTAVEERVKALEGRLESSTEVLGGKLDKVLEGLKQLGAKGEGRRYDEILKYHKDDYEGALEAARASGKQLFIDFTGYFCTNCRAMESSVLVHPRVTELLEGYERLILHTDNPNDREEQKRHRKLLADLGGLGSIPAYYILTPEGQKVAHHTGPASVDEFVAFLKTGKPQQQVGWIGFILSCIGLGLLTLAMPCTYPMIPITISIFSKGDKLTRAKSLGRAAIYAAGIIVSYTAIGGIVQIMFGGAGQQMIQDFANNGIVNLLIGGVFLYFAFSFFGYYEIAMPGVLQKLMQRGQATPAGDDGVPAWSLFLMGAFFMLTSYSCGAPFVLAVFERAASTPHPLSVVLALFVFSSTIALPFLGLALLPGALRSMPRAGGWFNTFKATLGFLELAFALKFLSTSDISFQLAILTRPVFLGIWILVLALLGLYLLGFLRFPHDAPVETLSMGRFIGALLTLCAAIYLAGWFAGHKLDPRLDALLPPHPYETVLTAKKDGG